MIPNLLCRIDAADVDTQRFRPHWHRITLVAVMALLACGLLLSGSVWLYLTRARNLSDIRYADTLTPGGWRSIRTAIGDRALGDAAEALKLRDIDTAVRLYRVGLAKSPRNAPGRIALARLYTELRRPDLARDLLVGGLPVLAENPEYLRLSLGFLLEFQFDAELRQVAEPLLRHRSPAVRRQAALHCAAVAFHRGDFDGAESILARHRLADSAEGALLLARGDFERGYPELALARLTPALNESSTQAAALALASRIHARLGRTPDLARTAILRLADDPLSPAPRLAVLQQLHDQDRPAELDRETDTYLRLFTHDASALLALGDFAANTGQPELARRIQQVFAEHRWPPEAPALLYAEACLAARRYAEGLAELDRQFPSRSRSDARYGPALDGLRAVALFGLGHADEAQLQLEHLLAQPNLRAENLSAVATRLLAFGRVPSARTVLARAVELDARNQPALAALVRLEAELGQIDALSGHLRQFLAVRRPSHEVLVFVYRRLGSDLYLLHPEQRPLLAELRQRIERDDALASARNL
ncbi:tetratricopeptide repeat protein [Oleiharenicola sp. Vm1]|uniref:tetratricopeptide repeat protein n=1 Tax=Oleiharenicola sp. Vm1 TaxID=3398393 RepID=UPI0039F53D35